MGKLAAIAGIILICILTLMIFLGWKFILGFTVGLSIIPLAWKISVIYYDDINKKDYMEYDDEKKNKLIITRSKKSFHK